jgi:uncharacterized protein (TIGR02246 family)
MKRTLQSAILVFVSMMVISSCSEQAAEAKIDVEKLKPEIQKMEDAFAAAEKAKDAAAVAAYYSEDAVSYPRNEAPLSGKAAIQERIAKRLANDTTGTTSAYKVVDLFAEGNLVVEIGSWTETNPAGAETGKGHYMSVFQKIDGKYVCIRDMSVSSNPARTQ